VCELIARVRAAAKGGRRILVCYEAGYDGFWVARSLARENIECRVLDPASIQVNHRARRVKTDRIDVLALFRTSRRKIALHDELADLGVQLLDLSFAVDRAVAVAVFESPCRLFQKLLLPGVNLVGMHLIGLRQVGHRFVLAQCFQRNLRLRGCVDLPSRSLVIFRPCDGTASNPPSSTGPKFGIHFSRRQATLPSRLLQPMIPRPPQIERHASPGTRGSRCRQAGIAWQALRIDTRNAARTKSIIS
jgi:hypothetical protein